VGRRRGTLSVGVVLVLFAAGCAAPRLQVESARVDFPDARPGTPGRLELNAYYGDLTFDPKASVRLDIVGESTRWLFLKPLASRPTTLAVDGEEHGYAMILDLARHQVTLIEPDVFARRANPVEIRLGQDERFACVRLWFVDEGEHWTLDETSGSQAACRR
jgi:hypothetical protein